MTMNRLSIQQRVQVINALVEGKTIRPIFPTTGVAKNTAGKLLAP
jgi:uncharacterized protein YerC